MDIALPDEVPLGVLPPPAVPPRLGLARVSRLGSTGVVDWPGPLGGGGDDDGASPGIVVGLAAGRGGAALGACVGLATTFRRTPKAAKALDRLLAVAMVALLGGGCCTVAGGGGGGGVASGTETHDIVWHQAERHANNCASNT